jgi:hypothetical protein
MDCDRCGERIIEIDRHGERLIGCLECNCWSSSRSAFTVVLSAEDFDALKRAANEKSLGAAEALLSIDSNVYGVKPRKVARFSLSRHRSPPKKDRRSPAPPSALLFVRIESVPQ